MSHFLCHEHYGEHGGEPLLKGLPRRLGEDVCCFCGKPATYFAETDVQPKTEFCEATEFVGSK